MRWRWICAAAAVGVGEDGFKRVEALIAAEVDVLVVDTATWQEVDRIAVAGQDFFADAPVLCADTTVALGRTEGVVVSVPAGQGASIQDLAIFAWQEFIALTWTAADPTSDVAVGSGAFNLVRRSALDRSPGLASARAELVRLVKAEIDTDPVPGLRPRDSIEVVLEVGD